MSNECDTSTLDTSSEGEKVKSEKCEMKEWTTLQIRLFDA